MMVQEDKSLLLSLREMKLNRMSVNRLIVQMMLMLLMQSSSDDHGRPLQ